jgi:hypothetical protein
MSTALDAFLKRENIDDPTFAASINRDRSIVSKIRRGVLRPTLDVAAAIEAATRGEVPMQAWTDLGAADHDATDTVASPPPSCGNSGEVSAQVPA